MRRKINSNNNENSIIVNDLVFKRYFHDGIPTSYFVSECGCIYSELSNKILKHSICRNGY